MAKKVVTFALHKTNKKPISKKQNLKKIMSKIMNYMTSDTYAFAPLVNPQSSLTSSPTTSLGGEVSLEPIKKKEKKLVKNVEDYLKCDCYMYAPLAVESAADCATAPIEVSGDQITTPAKKIGVKRIRVQQETVKHILHLNCRSSTLPGKTLSHEEPHKASVK